MRMSKIIAAIIVLLLLSSLIFVAPAALAALGRIRPSDLPTRLKPLLSKEAPTMARQAARAALSRRRACPR